MSQDCIVHSLQWLEIFGLERVTISLKWTQGIHQGLLVFYIIVIVTPMISNTRVNITLAYNTPYNVSVVADFCGQRNSTTLIELNYGEYNSSEFVSDLSNIKISCKKSSPGRDDV